MSLAGSALAVPGRTRKSCPKRRLGQFSPPRLTPLAAAVTAFIFAPKWVFLQAGKCASNVQAGRCARTRNLGCDESYQKPKFAGKLFARSHLRGAPPHTAARAPKVKWTITWFSRF